MWRVQRGKRGSDFGFWVSKPGVDVTTAQPGQFLFDMTSHVYQTVLKGDTRIVIGSTIPAGTYTQSVPLPAEYANQTNVMMQAVLYYIFSNGGSYDDQNYGLAAPRLTFRVVSGVLTLQLTLFATFGPASFSMDVRVGWSIFRAKY